MRLVTRATSSATVTASSSRTTPVTRESVRPVRTTAPADRIFVTSAVWMMSIHGLSKKALIEERDSDACVWLRENTLTTKNDEVFTGRRAERLTQGVEANARAVVEGGNPALLWERWADGKGDSRGRRTRGGRNLRRSPRRVPENHVAPVQARHRHNHLTLSHRLNYGLKQMSKQLQFKLVLLGMHPSHIR